MTRRKQIPLVEIHGVDTSGTKYVLNHLTGDNVGVQGHREPEAAHEQLKDRAQRMVSQWQTTYPQDHIFVALV